MNQTKVCIKVPASTANLGPGFDCLGMALDIYAWIEMDFALKTKIILHGEQMLGIPLDKSNLIYKVAQMVFAEAGVSHPELEIAMYSEIPLTRGLGSSASAIIGGMVAANALIGNLLSQDKIFLMATQLEKHPDNVGASLFGGIVVASWDGVRADYIRIAPHERLEVLVAIPEFQLSTELARHALPKEVSMKDAVFNLSHSSLLVAALCSGNLEMIRHAMQDVLHQPYRAALVPGMEMILKEATDHGALGVALSGAGPTLLALVDKTSHEKAGLAEFMQNTLLKEDIKSTMMWLKPEALGVQVLANSVSLAELAAHK
ncbi:homoserine kinase [Paenibacillus psychroresistens]|uniref:Homoserine kinase n=1 Tax=Paenibacillus psychroresistens TaxID=1778678 RepID=A0A6B8RH44_9BACL|nr:homoserine kinase [Paenibacillus psychroresistens]QGQ95409.1 homoserine kinase [Paenibacillus psychroresistens]